jgi:hypothetical protein
MNIFIHWLFLAQEIHHREHQFSKFLSKLGGSVKRTFRWLRLITSLGRIEIIHRNKERILLLKPSVFTIRLTLPNRTGFPSGRGLPQNLRIPIMVYNLISQNQKWDDQIRSQRTIKKFRRKFRFRFSSRHVTTAFLLSDLIMKYVSCSASHVALPWSWSPPRVISSLPDVKYPITCLCDNRPFNRRERVGQSVRHDWLVQEEGRMQELHVRFRGIHAALSKSEIWSRGDFF